MRGIVKGLAFIVPFWVAVIYVLAVNGWIRYVFISIGALCLIVVIGMLVALAYEWKSGALKNTNQPDSGSSVDGDAVRPDDADSGSDL